MSKEQIKQFSDEAYDAVCRNDLTTALDRYNKVLAIDPTDDSSLHFYAIILNLQGKHKTALEMVKRAINRYKCSAGYYTTLASICKNLEDYPAAIQAIRTAAELRPRDPVILSNAAMILMDERRYGSAKEIFEAALDIDPHNAFVHFNYSLLLLATGDYENGWKEYEWRIPFHYGKLPPEYPTDLKDKNIQIIPDQGYGDFIMFSRYVNLLEKAGAKPFITCSKALSRLYDSHYCPKPDVTMYVTSLARLFNEIPNEPYIKAPGLKKIEDKGFKIGVASRALKNFNNDVRVLMKPDGGVHIVAHPSNLAYLSAFKRSLPHDFFDPFFSLRNVKLYNLQIDHQHYAMKNMSNQISDFGDLADFVDQMDLIITIDTALAHLAGAMGKKTWLLLPYDFEWRWQADREDSPWYPSMRIFRQKSRGDWYSVQDQLLNNHPVRLGGNRSE